MSASLIPCPDCGADVVLPEDFAGGAVCEVCGSSIAVLPEETQPIERRETEILDRFEMLETIGHGAFGRVWKARDQSLDRLVALKIPRDALLDATDRDMFLRDARAAARLEHPNIVPVHDVGEADGTVYIVSKLIEGVTLADRLTAGTPAIGEAVRLMTKVTDAVQHAHEHGIVHRDLKPSNILVDGHGEPHVIDFGLAKEDGPRVGMTVTGQVLGTPAYMSPEQARGRSHEVDARSDVYSLGVILFELLTGERPFRGNVRMMLQQVVNDDPPNPRTLNAAIPVDLSTIVLKCLDKAPERRYGSASALAEDLRRQMEGRTILARPPSLFDRTVKIVKRHRRFFATAATFLLALGVVVAVAFAQVLSERDRAVKAASDEAAVRRIAIASLRRTMDSLADDAELQAGPFEDLRSRLLATAEKTFSDLGQHADTLDDDEFEELRVDLAWLSLNFGDANRADAVLGGEPTEGPKRYNDSVARGTQLDRSLKRLEVELRVAARRGDTEQADKLSHTVVELVRRAADEITMSNERTRSALSVLSEAVSCLDNRSRSNDALGAASLADNLVDAGNLAPGHVLPYAWVGITRSDALLSLERFDETIDERLAVRSLLEKHKHEIDTEGIEYLQLRRNIANGLGSANRELGRAIESRDAFEEAVTWADRVASLSPSRYQDQFSVGMTRYNLGNCLAYELGLRDQAEEVYEEAIERWTRLREREPRGWEPVHWLAAAKSNLADVMLLEARHAEAERLAREAIELRESFGPEADAKEWANGNWRTFLAIHYYCLANAHFGQDKSFEGNRSLLRACRIMSSVIEGDRNQWRRTRFITFFIELLGTTTSDPSQLEEISKLFGQATRVADALADVSDRNEILVLPSELRSAGTLHGKLRGAGLGRRELFTAAVADYRRRLSDDSNGLLSLLASHVRDEVSVVECREPLRTELTAVAELSEWTDPRPIRMLARVEWKDGEHDRALELARLAVRLCDDGANVTPADCADARSQLAVIEEDSAVPAKATP